MGGNVRIDEATLRARAMEIQQQMSEVGVDLTTNPITDKKTGAIFTYTRAANGEISCAYSYHNEQPRDIILFKRTVVPTSAASLGDLNDKQLEEYLENYPGHFYATGYAASDEQIARKEFAEQHILSPDKKTRKAAENVYKDTVSMELMASGTYDKKAAGKLAKYALNDAKAGVRAENRVVYFDKSEYEIAKKQLEYEQKAAKNRIKLYQKAGMAVPPEDEALLLKSVSYIKDKDVRRYVESHKERFFDENGKFSNTKYHEWAEAHLQGDNTLTTSERKPASITTGLSKGDMVKGVKYAGYDAQKDHVLAINLAKTLVGVISGPLIAYMTNHNIHDIKELKDVITVTADSADPSKYTVFVDGVSIAEARSEVIANFRDVAVRNAILSSVLATIFNNGLVDPAGARDRKAEGITAATISTQNIFRGKDVTNINGEIAIGGHDNDGNDDEVDGNSCFNYDGTPAVEGKEATPDEDVFNLKMNQKCNVIFWYQTADAYELPEGVTKQNIYNRIRELNGDPNHDKYPPSVVGLPKEITITTRDGKQVTIQRKEKFNIKGQCYEPTGKGKKRGTGKTYVGYKGTPAVEGKPGNYRVYDCENPNKVYVEGLPSEDAALDWIDAHSKK